MLDPLHPKNVLFDSGDLLPAIPSCDHYAGTEKLVLKSFELQESIGPLFEITCDLEDGSRTGGEKELLEAFINLLRSPNNKYRMAGIRIHDYHSPYWKDELETIVGRVGDIISHITIPKTQSKEELAMMIEHLQRRCEKVGLKRKIPVHVLIESQRALAQVWEIAALPWLRGLDFGIMDFISAHGGAIPAASMVSPGQFTHKLIVRAKAEIAAAALAHNLIPSHNVTTAYADADLTRRDAEQAKNEFGYLRMWSIHPSQISVIVDVMKPTFDEIQKGTRILLAAREQNWGPVIVDGILHDRASFRYFWNLLRRAHINKVSIDPQAIKLFFSDV